MLRFNEFMKRRIERNPWLDKEDQIKLEYWMLEGAIESDWSESYLDKYKWFGKNDDQRKEGHVEMFKREVLKFEWVKGLPQVSANKRLSRK